MAKNEYNPKTIPQCRIDPQAIHTTRRKLQSLSKDGRIDFDRQEREALLRLIIDGKGDLYPESIDLDTYQSNLHQLTEIDKNKQPFRWTSVANRIEEFEEKFCV